MSLQFLQPYFGLGNGLQTKNAGGGAGVGGWVELGRTTLGADSATINVSSLSNKRYYMYLIHGFIGPRFIESRMRFNSDTGTSYAHRGSDNGGADVTLVNINNMVIDGTQTSQPRFQMGYVSNFSTKEKLLQGWSNIATAGAGTAPIRNEMVAKWANTSSSINAFNLFTSDTASDKYGSGSELVVLGWDPADTHTNNFWTELATNTLTSSASSIPLGTITAKKYLWVQVYGKPTGGTANGKLQFNSDTGSNYSVRQSDNGGADATQVSQSAADLRMGELAQPAFSNIFIVNTTSKEKLFISHTVNQNSAGAGTAPERYEVVGKWANTSAQITNINIIKTSGGSFDTGSTATVWGAD